MRPRQVLPYLAALLLLVWILGTLARSGTGSSILANSYWLVYAAQLLPFFALGAMAVLVIELARNWRAMSDALGFGIAQRRRIKQKRKTHTKVQMIVWTGFWVIAIGTLFWKCGGIVCKPGNSTQTLPDQIASVVDNSTGTRPIIPGIFGTAYALSDFVESEWFSITFLSLLAVSSVILARSFWVSRDQVPFDGVLPAAVRQEGSAAVEDALGILRAQDAGDSRSRILACYERMIKAATSLGARVSVDQTARELEAGIRLTFQLKGGGIADLTRLFEEARYSLHSMTEEDSEQAQRCLLEIGEELQISLGSLN